MRVLHIYKDYAPVVGGIENHIRVLSEGLRQSGVDARVLVTNTGRETRAEDIGGVPVLKTGRALNISTAPIAPRMFSELRRMESDAEIAHVHSPYPPGELGQLLLGTSRRTVVSYHSDIVRQRVMGALYGPFLRLLLRRADLIAVASPAYIRSSAYLAPVAEKCRVIPYGIGLERFARTQAIANHATQLRERYGSPLLVFVGRLRHYKGIDVLLTAMQNVDAHLLIVGTGPLGKQWRAQMERDGHTERVTFAGDFSDEAVVAAYRAADVFVLPSTNRAEAFGIVQIEAMACGLPIVSTELGTGTSFVNVDGETGFVVPPNNPGALSAALSRLLNDATLRHTMGANALARARDEFGSRTMVTRMIAFYQEALLGL